MLGLAACGLLACGPRQLPEAGAAAQAGPAARGLWFQLRQGRLEQISGPGGISSTGMRPWTVQERIADMVELAGRPYLAVNGHGVAALSLGQSGFPQFRTFYDPLLFRRRTFTRMLPRGGSLLCHAYFNSLLNETTADSLELKGISLLELFPEDGVYRHRTPVFQRRNPDWECVGFAPTGREQAVLAWKHSAPRETRFAYTLFDLAGGGETAASQEAYRQALAFGPLGEQADPALRAVARAAAERSGTPGVATGLQFLLRGSGESLERRYQILPPGFENAERIFLLTLPVRERGGRFSLLCPDGILLWANAGTSRAELAALPALPEGFAYTDLLLSGGLILAAWEQEDFTRVGAAGLLLLEDPRPSP